MPIKAVIFDLDGTLLDTVNDLADASNRVLQDYGHPIHPVDSYRYFVGDGLMTLMERVTPAEVSGEGLKKYFDRFKAVYKENWDNKTVPYPGIIKMLEQMEEKKISCSILSNKPHEFTLVCVERFFPGLPFNYILGQREGIPKKPDPAGAVEIAEKLNVAPSECLYVGDTSTDMKTGKGAGMVTMGVLWGFRKKDELVEHGADVLVTAPKEIVDYVVSSH